ncbi:MAG: hypothetical protein DRR19_05480 [Candidatus Parabeggiatoa sp. nov. 1]|nr:MAG: hypothetical protein DRR19_05480 [Gammaproteobacteria bacterium]
MKRAFVILQLKKTSEVLETSEISVSVKIIDFGLSQVVPSLRQQAMTVQHKQTGLSQFGQAVFGTLIKRIYGLPPISLLKVAQPFV